MNINSVYKKIAKQHGVTIEDVKKEMQDAIDEAWKNCPKEGESKLMQNSVPSKDSIPTTEELLKFIAQKLKDNQRDS